MIAMYLINMRLNFHTFQVHEESVCSYLLDFCLLLSETKNQRKLWIINELTAVNLQLHQIPRNTFFLEEKVPSFISRLFPKHPAVNQQRLNPRMSICTSSAGFPSRAPCLLLSGVWIHGCWTTGWSLQEPAGCGSRRIHPRKNRMCGETVKPNKFCGFTYFFFFHF